MLAHFLLPILALTSSVIPNGFFIGISNEISVSVSFDDSRSNWLLTKKHDFQVEANNIETVVSDLGDIFLPPGTVFLNTQVAHVEIELSDLRARYISSDDSIMLTWEGSVVIARKLDKLDGFVLDSCDFIMCEFQESFDPFQRPAYIPDGLYAGSQNQVYFDLK